MAEAQKKMTLNLKEREPFARGGNRLCFVHPDASDLCVKVLRPGRSPSEKRRQKGFPKNLRPLKRFDDNLEEFVVLTGLLEKHGQPVLRHIPHCYGWVQTDYGKGLVTDIYRDQDGRISMTLKQYIWDLGYDERCEVALAELADFWLRYSILSRDLILHNIVTQEQADGSLRLIVIDGLGSSDFLPLASWFTSRARLKAERKIDNLYWRVDELLKKKKEGRDRGINGFLSEQQRQ